MLLNHCSKLISRSYQDLWREYLRAVVEKLAVFLLGQGQEASETVGYRPAISALASRVA